MVNKVNSKWLVWVEHNLSRGCEPHGIMDILLENQFNLDEIKRLMGKAFPIRYETKISLETSIEQKNKYKESKLISQKHEEIIPSLSIEKIQKANQGLAIKEIKTDKVQLLTIDDFLSERQCEKLIDLIEPNLKSSDVTFYNGDNNYRTSKTCHLASVKSRIIQELNEKIADVLNLPLAFSEPIQAQKYHVSEEFKPHTDYFEPNTPEFEEYAKVLGQRTWTFLIYLAETSEGGATRFINIDKSFYPKVGQAVAWNNLYSDGQPNPDTLHQGEPVLAGSKTIITKWFRTKEQNYV